MAATPDATNAGFEYPILAAASRQIRLFTLDDVDEHGVLHCTLRSAMLDEGPTYIALSYVWGARCAEHYISVNGQPFKVRRNLFDFLATVAAFELVGISIFIDAICINQIDLEERNNQVRLMRDIYSSAEQVIAWLGQPASKEEPDEEIDVLGNNFWSRLWIVQEVVLAPRLRIQLGEYTYSPESLYDLGEFPNYARAFEMTRRLNLMDEATGTMQLQGAPVHWLTKLDGKHVSREDRQTIQNMSSAFMILVQRHRWQENASHERNRPLHEVLTLFGTQQCKERHDKIFGLLGLARSRVGVDYKIPILSLYLQVLIEGLHQLAAASNLDPNRSTQFGRFHFACMGTFGLANDQALFLITYRAMQHCNVIPRSHNLLLGIRALLTNVLLYDVNAKLMERERRYAYWLKYCIVWIYACIASVTICLLLQHARKQNSRFGPPYDHKRSFDEWITLVDEVADDVCRSGKFETSLPLEATDQRPEWRGKEVKGIPGALFVVDLLAIVLGALLKLAGKLWRFFKARRRGKTSAKGR